MEKPKYTEHADFLSEVGNIKGELPERRIIPHGHFDICYREHKLPNLILKNYFMEEIGKATPILGDIAYWTLLENEFNKRKFKSLSGLGFLIASSGIMNVCRWDNEYIDVIVPKIYISEKGEWIPQEVEKVGAFCSGEKRVYDHENKAWLQYLNSERTNEDKLTYLNDFLVE